MYLPSNFDGHRCCDVRLSGDVSYPYSYLDTLEILILKSQKKGKEEEEMETNNRVLPLLWK